MIARNTSKKLKQGNLYNRCIIGGHLTEVVIIVLRSSIYDVHKNLLIFWPQPLPPPSAKMRNRSIFKKNRIRKQLTISRHPYQPSMWTSYMYGPLVVMYYWRLSSWNFGSSEVNYLHVMDRNKWKWFKFSRFQEK